MCRCLSILLVTFILSAASIAEPYEFIAVYAEVPGIEKIRTGDLDAAIEILERRRTDKNKDYVVGELATLCALYVTKGRLDVAHTTCHAAVENEQSHVAYNNRGVLRAHLGDTKGALEDFDRARVLPADQHHYIEEVKLRDARFIASNNFAAVTGYVQSRTRNQPTVFGTVHGAKIEESQQMSAGQVTTSRYAPRLDTTKKACSSP